MKVLLLAERLDAQFLAEALQHGASGCLEKSKAPHRLCDAISALSRGELYLGHGDASLGPAGEDSLGARIRSLLTDRERQIVKLLADGYRSRRIANELDLPEQMVEVHVSMLQAKLGLSSTLDLIWIQRRLDMEEE